MTMTAETTALDEARIRCAMRHLQRSGRRLIQRSKDWAIVGGNAAVFALLTQRDVALMAAKKLIAPAEGGGHIAMFGAEEPAGGAGAGGARVAGVEETAGAGGGGGGANPGTVPRTGAWVFDAAGYARPKQKGAGFASLASRAQAGEGPLTLRQVMAGLRLISDAEQSLRGERLGMDWSGIVRDGQRRRGCDGGLAFAARRARGRIQWLRKDLGDAFPLVWSACVDRASIRALARARRVGGREVQHRLSMALEKLAAAYDGVKA